MSYMLGHLHNGWQVDQAILSEEDRVVVIRFGHDWDPTCMKMDEVLYSIAEKVKNFAVIYLVDITEVPDFNKMYELYDPCTVMFFFRNKHIMIDLEVPEKEGVLLSHQKTIQQNTDTEKILTSFWTFTLTTPYGLSCLE
ncbi:unnamed protein product [Leptosia nina]|uniref:Thioredoxin-like protein n=1 Tax=Leptosia nina TaxID=320188 RepID=A0AAV1J027_9NEOP